MNKISNLYSKPKTSGLWLPGSRYLLFLLMVAIVFLFIGCSAAQDEQATANQQTAQAVGQAATATRNAEELSATDQAIESANADATGEAATREAEEEAARQATAEVEQTVAVQASADAQATAEAEIAIAVEATIAAEATANAQATANAEATATAAYEATRVAFEAEQVAVLEAAKEDTPIVTLEEGILVHDEDEEPESQAAEVNLGNFVIEAHFSFEPGDTGFKDGDFGLEFHLDADNFSCLLINQDGAWQLINSEDGDTEIIQEGQTTLLSEGWNEIALYVDGTQGFFTLNGQYVDELDIDQSGDPGDIALVTAFNPGSELADASIEFKEFKIWSLDPIPPTPTPAPTSAPPPPPAALKFPETPVKPFDRDEFVSYVGRLRDSLRSYTSEMDLMQTTYKPGDCGTFYGWIGLWRRESPFYSDIPPAFTSLHREYRSMLFEVVTLSQEILEVCDAGGGFVTDETIDGINEFLAWAYPRSEQIVSEASVLPG